MVKTCNNSIQKRDFWYINAKYIKIMVLISQYVHHVRSNKTTIKRKTVQSGQNWSKALNFVIFC